MNRAWYAKRLLAMSAGEVAFRIGFSLTKRRWRKRGVPQYPPEFRPSAERQMPLAGIIADPSSPEVRRLLDEANAALRHEWRFFGLEGVAEETIDWHLDPVAGLSAPKIFAYDIDHRNRAVAGDPKVIWEKSRHHHLTILAAAYALTRREAYAAEAADQLLDWIMKNPCPVGINWGHPLELGIRLISWVWLERLLRGSAHHDRAFGPQSPVWGSIGQHQTVIARAYSRGSSANNHLIGEMAGLFIAAAAFPVFRRSAHWLRLGQRALEREIVKQTYPSGINRELAFGYHLFTAEFFLLAQYEAEATGLSFSARYRGLVSKMLEAIPALVDAGGNLPRFGDGDDGMALQLQSFASSRTDWLLQLGSVLLGTSNTARPGEPSLPLVLMGVADRLPARVDPPTDAGTAFPDAGIFVMANNRGRADEVFVVADAGPLGFGALAAHGHADALSFTLSAGGKPIFIDPGTFSYYTDRAVRAWFRSTCGHNTLTVDDRDQSTASGPFLWSSRANVSADGLHFFEGGAELTGSHDGYARSLGIFHFRTFRLDGSVLQLQDRLSGGGEHLVRLCFHCPPECRIEQCAPNRLIVQNGGVSAAVTVEERLELSIHKGEQSGGWYSPRYGVRTAAWSIFVSARLETPATLSTTIEVLHGC